MDCFENGIRCFLKCVTNDNNNLPVIRMIDINAQIQKNVVFSNFGLTRKPDFITLKYGNHYYSGNQGNV